MRKMVYVASQYRGNIELNEYLLKGAMRLTLDNGHLPVAPHMMYTQILDEEVEEERNMGLQLGIELLNKCHEMFVFCQRIGKLLIISEGMKMEIKECVAKNIPMTFIPIDRGDEVFTFRDKISKEDAIEVLKGMGIAESMTKKMCLQKGEFTIC